MAVHVVRGTCLWCEKPIARRAGGRGWTHVDEESLYRQCGWDRYGKAMYATPNSVRGWRFVV